jgi:hypothetical protein
MDDGPGRPVGFCLVNENCGPFCIMLFRKRGELTAVEKYNFVVRIGVL